MSFLTQRRLVSDGLRASTPILYIFDLISLLFVLGVYLGVTDLAKFGRGMPGVTVSAVDFAMIGSIGFYGMRLATWIALLRGNRMPQTAEWLVFLASLAAALVCLVASGPLVRAYADTHHYRFCFKQDDHGALYTFAAAGAACPAKPPPAHDD